MLRKTILFLLTIFILSGCSTTPEITVVRPDGGPSPDPQYILQTTSQEQPIQLTFYYVATDKVEDLDGSKQPSISFLERRKVYYFSKKSTTDLHTVLRVLNPRNLRYKIHYRMHITFSDSGRMDAYSEIAYSDMKYREIICPLPLSDGIKYVEHEVDVTDNIGNVLIRTGQFKYHIN
jgi:hypothetical protein